MAVGRDDKGLIVPNVKDCDRKNVAQLAAEVNDIATRARNDRLRPDDIQDGTFSITNAGVYGAINSPIGTAASNGQTGELAERVSALMRRAFPAR